MSPHTKALPLILILAGLLPGQGTQVDCAPASQTFTTATTGTPISNANTATPCVRWEISYNSSGFSAFSIQIETSPDNITFTAVPNTVCSSTVQPPCVREGANPSTTIGNQFFSVNAYGRFVRLNVTSVTGSGSITARVFGYKGLSASRLSVGGGASGTVTNVQIAGTARQITVSGGCTITTTGVCTLSLPLNLLFNAATTAGASFNIPSGVAPTSPVSGDFWQVGGILYTTLSISSGVNAPFSAYEFLPGLTSGGFGWAAPDIAGTPVLILTPTNTATANTGDVLQLDAGTTCGTYDALAPANCRQAKWSPAGGSTTIRAVSVSAASTNSIGASGFGDVEFDTTVKDTAGGAFHSNSSNKAKFTPDADGWYRLTCTVQWGAVGTQGALGISKNGAAAFGLLGYLDRGNTAVAVINQGLTTGAEFYLLSTDVLTCSLLNGAAVPTNNYVPFAVFTRLGN
jgi:hypothetical protein